MTTLHPGCFGSVAVAQASVKTCEECPSRVACFPVADARLASVLERLSGKLRARGVDEKTLEKRLERVKLHADKSPPRIAARNMPRSDALARAISEAGIDVAQMKARKNPFPISSGVQYLIAKFVLEGVPFKPKDVIERLRDEGVTTPQASLVSEVSRFITVLVEAGVLERKERNIICLSPREK